MTFTTVNAMKAFSPIYGAIAKGRFAYNPIRRVPNDALTIVATIDAPKGIPAASSIFGLTMMIYAIVTNVVRPARISCLMVEPSCLSLKNEEIEVMVS
jgi:hypothetical protein